MRLTDDYMSITIINSTWFFKVEYEVDDSGLCSVTCRRLCAVLVSNIMPLSSHRSLPCRGVRSRRAAGAVLNSDGSGSRAAINRRSIKE